MTMEYTNQGYWIAYGTYEGRRILAEGDTRIEAMRNWLETARQGVEVAA